MNILFPSDTFDERKIDSDLKDQFDVAMKLDFGVGLVDLATNKFRVVRPPQSASQWIYRGWMLNGEKYQRFYTKLHAQGVVLLTDCGEYLKNHHISGWIEALHGITPRTMLFQERDELINNSNKIDFSPWFIKDYVKSLKTRRGSIAKNINEAIEILDEIEKYRGEIEGGIAVRQCMEFIADTEKRYFIFNSRVINPVAPQDSAIIDVVLQRLLGRKFYSVDVIQDSSGKKWIVEIGDGQVSDLVGGIEAASFYDNFNNIA